MIPKYQIVLVLSLFPFCSVLAQCKSDEVKVVNNRERVGIHGTLNPKYFEGATRQAFAVAARDPELLSNLFLYDGSERTNRTLLDSFKTTWAAEDKLSQVEAIEAAQLKGRGLRLNQIQKALNDKYRKFHPNPAASSIYQEYRKKWQVQQN